MEAGTKIHLRKSVRKWSIDESEPIVVVPTPAQAQAQAELPTTSKKQSNGNNSSYYSRGGHSSSSYDRHRSVPAESPELLALSGDVRCFKV